MALEAITVRSRQNAGVKLACALLDKKTREKERMFRFDGIKLFGEAVLCGVEIERVYIKEASYGFLKERLGADLIRYEHKTVLVSDEVFDKMTEERAAEGIITVAKYIDKSHKSVTIDNNGEPQCAEDSVMLLESLRDPGNLGTMIRSAAALGIDRLVLSSDCADIYNPKTIRAAMGGLFRLRIDKLSGVSMPEYVGRLRKSGRKVYAAALDENASRLGELEISSKDCVVIGNEGHGLSEETVRACDQSVIIPMVQGCESLNAAAAAVIFMWELKRASDR